MKCSVVTCRGQVIFCFNGGYCHGCSLQLLSGCCCKWGAGSGLSLN